MASEIATVCDGKPQIIDQPAMVIDKFCRIFLCWVRFHVHAFFNE
jgi:hypothetical protein